MNQISVEIIVAVATFVSSIGMSAFIAGTRWGRVETEMRSITERVAKIEGMFTLTLKKGIDP